MLLPVLGSLTIPPAEGAPAEPASTRPPRATRSQPARNTSHDVSADAASAAAAATNPAPKAPLVASAGRPEAGTGRPEATSSRRPPAAYRVAPWPAGRVRIVATRWPGLGWVMSHGRWEPRGVRKCVHAARRCS